MTTIARILRRIADRIDPPKTLPLHAWIAEPHTTTTNATTIHWNPNPPTT